VTIAGRQLAAEPVPSVSLDWVGALDEAGEDAEARYVMLASPAATPLEPLVQAA
jgi:hypothetical protein